MHPIRAASLAMLVSFAAAVPQQDASASTTAKRVFEGPAMGRPANRASTYAINAELGRAWVEISFVDPAPEEPPRTLRVRIPGLYFDAATSAILYRAKSGVVECAKVDTGERSRWAPARIQPTGRCNVTFKDVRERFDDGFEIAEVDRFVVYFSAA